MNKSGKKPVGRPKLTPAQKYAKALQRPGTTQAQAAALAGYSPSTSPHKINQYQAVQAAKADLEGIREALRLQPGYTMEDMLIRLKQVSDGTAGLDETKGSDVIAAIREMIAVLGYKAPDKQEISHRGLYLHLTGYTREQIAQAYQAQTGTIPEAQEEY